MNNFQRLFTFNISLLIGFLMGIFMGLENSNYTELKQEMAPILIANTIVPVNRTLVNETECLNNVQIGGELYYDHAALFSHDYCACSFFVRNRNFHFGSVHPDLACLWETG